MITVKAEDVVSKARSLLAKANKTTGKEHKSLSEAFEDLTLGYGVDQTEVFDGNIELEGEFEPGEPETIDYYQKGYNEGYSKGLEAGGGDGGFEEGKAEVYAQIEPINAQLENTLNGTDTGGKSYYDEFWDLYQQNGKRTDYQYGGFAGIGWTDETYKPKYPVKPINAYGMYTGCRLTNILDVDTSIATSITNLFYVCPFLERVGIISAVLAREAMNAFSYCTNLKTIDRFIVTEQLPYSNTFFNCTSLENLTIEGVIGQDGLNLQWSTKLSKASIISIINALSTTASGKSVTLSKVAVESAFGSTASEEWISLINARSNWTINLV